MHFILLNQFYPPDLAPTGRYLKELADALEERGHRVEVICSADSYSTTGRRSRWQKAWAFLRFYVYAYDKLRHCKPAPDILLSLTTPPYIAWVAQRALRRRSTRLAQWIMDLYPDVLVADGMLKEHGVLHRLLGRIADSSYQGSACVIALGPDMAERLLRSCKNPPPVQVLPLWAELANGPAEPVPSSACTFLYAGNLGRGHDLSPFLDTAKKMEGREGIRWVFSGEGPRKAAVEDFARRHPRLPITVGDYVPLDLLQEHLRAGDVHLVSMQSAWKGCIVPSKLQAAFALGRPVLFVGPIESSPARWICEAGGGWVVDLSKGDDLSVAVLEALDSMERVRRGRAAREFAEQHFDRRTNCNRMCAWLEAL